MTVIPVMQEKAEKIINNLPPTAYDELLVFLDYLQYKYQNEQPAENIKLAGLWADLDFDVSDDDVRQLRQQITHQAINTL